MPKTNFQPIFDYIDQAKKEILDEVPSKSDFDKLKTSVDTLAKRFDTVEKNLTVTTAKAEKVEHWAIKAGDKIEVPYKP